jgi:DNA invertase Pin-like site-specific DNA recombinase
MKGIAYCRVSSQEQVQGTSLDGQQQACLEYAKINNIEIAQIFVEKGESATAANRTELIRALDYCKDHKGEIGAFIVWKIDRFARNTTDHFAVRSQLMKYGTSLRSVTELIGDNPMGNMMETMLAGYAQFENEIRKQRCEGGMQRKIMEGIWPWQPPIGYTHSKKRTDRRKNLPDEKDPERFHIVQRALKEYAKGNQTIQGLTDLMNTWGMKTRQDKPMFKQLTEKMLRDKFYAGILVNPWDGKEYKGLHEPMISIEEYEKIQFTKKGYSLVRNIPHLRLNPDFPLRRLVHCSCGDRLTASWNTGGKKKKYGYYVCHNKECGHINETISKTELEKKFIKLLEKITPKQEFLDTFQIVIKDYWESEGHSLKTAGENYAVEIKRIEEKKGRLAQMRMNDEISKEEFGRMKDSLDNQILGLKTAQNEVKTDELNIEADLEYARQFIQNPARQWQDMDVSQKQRFQQRIFPYGIIYNKTEKSYGTAVLSAIFTLSEDFHTSKSDFVAGARLGLASEAYGASRKTFPNPPAR